jgi:AcrR family transcriptional regulator
VTAPRRIDEAKLIEAALSEFATRSYTDASVNTIIREAGISKGSFYYRFETKYDLYLHLLKTGVRQKWEFIRTNTPDSPEPSAPERPEAGSAPAGDIFDQFLLQARAGMEFARAHPRYHQLAIMFSREKGTTVYDDAIRELGLQDDAGLEQAIRAAVRNGEIRSDLSEPFLVNIITHLLVAFDQILFTGEDPDLETSYDRLEEYVEFLKHGLAPGSR